MGQRSHVTISRAKLTHFAKVLTGSHSATRTSTSMTLVRGTAPTRPSLALASYSTGKTSAMELVRLKAMIARQLSTASWTAVLRSRLTRQMTCRSSAVLRQGRGAWRIMCSSSMATSLNLPRPLYRQRCLDHGVGGSAGDRCWHVTIGKWRGVGIFW